ncbi:MAG TPA: sodium:alanine symporter family protein [Nitrospina sp.]|jgi:AGCS family alanine or glycine:cation symporter|nr:sodium:alanine symporter family protein [Nitrospinota bacterium]MDP6336567.1 sodium:alanine symporter family protein [Nitrospinaceae bacterium]MDP7148263.1 sodium:alanine symporter family protein [Nitrospinaceae bacterium]MDP7612272.1 sodium:alanine symporter family protein [Nitrospinaceae bacterium]HAX46743.1 sodium:alanine symporter family protein [Nitrospina sp.]|tara:strand:- start:59 stop:1408 length:1350 start_codon:yes stop_codon:yes gene_type:complete
MGKFFADFASLMWGPWLLILLLGAGLWLTFRLGGIQFRNLFYAFRLTFSKERSGKGDISHFGSLMTAMAATVGMGNIAGVSTAVALGGPGAIFWMWMTGLVGMATKYSESFLAVKYRQFNEEGEISGGPMYYLEHGLGQKWLGMCFAAFGALAAFGIGNMIQANTTATAVAEATGSGKFAMGIVLSVLTGLVIIGGIKRIAEVASYFVPIMVAIYLIGALVVIFSNLDHLGSGIQLIFEHAFSGTAATGGFLGASLAQTIRFGVARGLFSNESGMGSAPIAAAAAKTNHPGKQALVSMSGTFLDTLVVCSLTALALSSSGVWVSGETGVALTMQAFTGSLSGNWGSLLVTLSAVTFAFSSILAWEYYGEKCFEYLFGEKWVHFYRYLWVIFVFVGAMVKLEIVWNFSDAMNAMMTVPNLIGLILLSGKLSKETQAFEVGIREGTIDKFD